MLIKEFERQVRETPGNIAVKTPHNKLSYRELNNMANHIACLLFSIGRKPDKSGEQTVAALVFEQGAGMLAGMLGVLKANMIYVPISPDYPENRSVYMLKNSGAEILVTNNANRELAESLSRASDKDISIINIDLQDYGPEAANPDTASAEAEKAYILYTSGSTGVPKGIIQSRENVYYYTGSYGKCIALTPEDRMTLFSSFSHDAAVVDIFSGLLKGACLYPVGPREQLNPGKLAEWLIEEEITVWHSIPTLYRAFANALNGGRAFPKLRYIVLGGENVLLNDVLLREKNFPGTFFMNLYGQSEASFNSFQLVRPYAFVERITLGEAIEGTAILLVDEEGVEVEPLKAGEIIVACRHVALGYWKDEEKTAEAFGNDEEFERLYWTGDMGRLLLDGSIEYIGRKDFQMKIRGYRVEAGEIENRLLSYEPVKEAVVVGKNTGKVDTVLAAYYTASEKLTKALLKEHLLKELPEYMVPAHYIQLDGLPRTPNGKTDRKALLEMPVEEYAEAEYTETRNETERKIAEIWSGILGTERVNVRESFFDAGGNSMMLILFQTKLDEIFPGEVTVSDLFSYTTVEKLAHYILSRKNESCKKLEVEAVELPAEYFSFNGTNELHGTFDFKLEGSIYNDFRQLCADEGVDINTALLAIFSYALSQGSERTDISIQTLLQEADRIVPIKAELSGVGNMSQLFERFRHKLQALNSYHISEIENLIINKGNNHILPLFYDKKLLSEAAAKKHVYDILFEVSTGYEQCCCTLEFNENKLRKDKMKDILKNIVKLIRLFIKNKTQ